MNTEYTVIGGRVQIKSYDDGLIQVYPPLSYPMLQNEINALTHVGHLCPAPSIVEDLNILNEAMKVLREQACVSNIILWAESDNVYLDRQ